MKFLLFLAVVLLGLWLWRSGRRKEPAERADTPPPASGPQDMVRCAHCGVHLPQGDAIVGRIGYYCSPEHRQLAEP